MKQIITATAILSLFGASIAFAATKVQEIKPFDFIAHIGTEDSKDIKVYKVVDGDNTCYVTYYAGFSNGNNLSTSCVSVKK